MFVPWLSVRRVSILAALLVAGIARSAAAQTASTPGALVAYSTIYSVGLEWDLVGDTDHDARADVAFRVASGGDWTEALPLVRVDNGRNMLAGSLFFLTPDTEYVVRVSLLDPDGGGDSRDVTIRTRPVPALAPARVFHVVPGSGGGDGSSASPFRGVSAAETIARPGDTFLLHGGFYGGRVVFAVPGAAGGYIAWKAAGDGEVTMAGIDILASHLWLEGLTVRDQQYGTRTANAPVDVVLTRSRFFNNHYSIFLSGGGADWYIADNVIVGDTPAASGSDEGEGVELEHTGGHTVAHNSITNVADGVSYPLANVDIFGNDIFDTADDGVELDFGLANVRVWGNRIHNAAHNGVSFQPQSGGPWYIIRNQIVGSAEAPLKFRTTDRFVLLHNTIVNWGGWMFCCQPNDLLKAFARNNLWISADGGQMWSFDATARDWRTDLDYDGFDWGTGAYPFWYDGTVYYDVGAFAAASGLVRHGIRVFKDSCFQQFYVPGPAPMSVPPQVMSLQPSCNAVDAGVWLPNIDDGYTGSAPDLGAHEVGLPPASYGPRAAGVPPAIALTSPGNGASFTAPATIALAAAASDAGGVVTRVDFLVSGTLIATDATSPYSASWANVPAGTYTIVARAFDDAGLSASSDPITITVNNGSAPAPSGLPSPWAHQDVGAVGAQGSADSSAGVWSVRGSGADVWGTSDEFSYAYRQLTGDGEIVARVASLDNTSGWAKAGVMMRESLAAASAHAFMFVTPAGANGLAFQRRIAAGGVTVHTSGGEGAPPVWLKLRRSGMVITASASADGVGWTAVGSETIAMPSAIYVGLAVTSHDDGAIAAAAFDSVSVAAGAQPSTSDLPAPWLDQDVGATALGGSAGVSGGTWSMQGSGADVWGSADAFHFAYRPLMGDGAIVARVAALANTDPWAKAGVMMRSSLSADSPHAFMLVTPGANGLAFQRRVSVGGATVHTGGGSGNAPVWVKLARSGSTIVAYRSQDGVVWTEVGRDTLAMPDTIYVGLAATSHNDAALAGAAFEGVEVTAAGGSSWSHRDIGAVGASGDAVVSGDAAVVTASGADIWGTADAFHYLYRQISGDFAISVRVSAIEAVDAWTKAGVMIRASTQAGSAHASLFATPTSVKGLAFQRRPSADAASIHTAGPASAPPVWLRLSRVNGVVSAAYRFSAADGWITLASESAAGLPDTVLVGLAVTSHRDGVLASASFDGLLLEQP